MMGSDPWGNVELLTLTLSFPSNGKRYETLEKYRFYLSLDPPCIRRIVAGTLEPIFLPRCETSQTLETRVYVSIDGQ